MKKTVIAAILCVMLLFACESKTTGKRVSIPEMGNPITGAVTGTNSYEPKQEDNSADLAKTGKTAAQLLKEMQAEPIKEITQTTATSGTFYPPVTVTGTEREALKQKTRALFQKTTYDPNAKADTYSGSKYHSKDGDVINLPEGYSDNER